MNIHLKFWMSLVITALLCYVSVSVITNNIFIYTVSSISLIVTLYYFFKIELIKIKNRFTR
ncbi:MULTISPECIES: hypothetical protein [Mammaliicoccus]|uniref:hypothetical protein n=1 Tax=Mammaliicoccus TaxID=2803850 RepID=UPI00114FC321|nr:MULTISPECIES: hypothetical protein [Mammaliicoccus]